MRARLGTAAYLCEVVVLKRQTPHANNPEPQNGTDPGGLVHAGSVQKPLPRKDAEGLAS